MRPALKLTIRGHQGQQGPYRGALDAVKGKITFTGSLLGLPGSKRNLTFNLLDPDQIRLTLCYTNYRSLNLSCSAYFMLNNGLLLGATPIIKGSLCLIKGAAPPFIKGYTPWLHIS